MADKLTYSVREAANAIGIGRSMIYALISREELRCIHIGRRTLIPIDSVRKYLGVSVNQRVEEQASGLTEATYLVTIRRVPAHTDR